MLDSGLVLTSGQRGQGRSSVSRFPRPWTHSWPRPVPIPAASWPASSRSVSCARPSSSSRSPPTTGQLWPSSGLRRSATRSRSVNLHVHWLESVPSSCRLLRWSKGCELPSHSLRPAAGRRDVRTATTSQTPTGEGLLPTRLLSPPSTTPSPGSSVLWRHLLAQLPEPDPHGEGVPAGRPQPKLVPRESRSRALISSTLADEVFSKACRTCPAMSVSTPARAATVSTGTVRTSCPWPRRRRPVTGQLRDLLLGVRQGCETEAGSSRCKT